MPVDERDQKPELLGYTFFVPMPQSDGGADFSLVDIDEHDKPTCIRHGAMNKVTPSPPGFWRCLHISGCRAGAMEDPDAGKRWDNFDA